MMLSARRSYRTALLPDPKLAANAVTTDKILDGTILGGDIADNAIDVRHILRRVFELTIPLGTTVACGYDQRERHLFLRVGRYVMDRL